MARQKFDFDLIVIGSGAGGSAAATISAALGKRVAIIEKDDFGGESPNLGDIPMSAMLQTAQIFDSAKHGDRFGLRTNALSYNYPSIQEWKKLAVKRTGAGGNRNYYESKGISTFKGIARFITPHEITINRRHLSAENFLIATGSSFLIPNIPGLADVNFHTMHSALNITRPPKTMFIIGSNSRAIELAELFSTFGTKVYLADSSARILPNEDEEVGLLLDKHLKETKGITFLTHTRVLEVSKSSITKRVVIRRGGIERSINVEEVVVCLGTTPNVDLGLENADIEYDPTGIKVNNYLQTSQKHIFAAGDVLGRNSETQGALMESRVVAFNLYHRNKIIPDYLGAPRITWTNPNVVSIGMQEDDCLKRDLKVKKAIAPLNTTPRSNTADFRDGFVKLIADKNNVIIGATIVAPNGAEMAGELTLAVRLGMTAEQLRETPHAFLTWSEAIRIAASRLIN